MLSKKQLREQGIRALKKLANHPALKAKKEQQILTLLFASQQWKTSDTIAVTKALAFEFDTKLSIVVFVKLVAPISANFFTPTLKSLLSIFIPSVVGCAVIAAIIILLVSA